MYCVVSGLVSIGEFGLFSYGCFSCAGLRRVVSLVFVSLVRLVCGYYLVVVVWFSGGFVYSGVVRGLIVHCGCV